MINKKVKKKYIFFRVNEEVEGEEIEKEDEG